MSKKVLTDSDFEKMYEKDTVSFTAHLRLTRAVVGGQPADEKGVRAFVKYQMKLTNPDAIEAEVARILKEEIGEKDTTPEEGQVPESGVYQVCVVRRDENGPWLGDWMFKALFKQAATQVELFVKKRAKGNVAEAGRLTAYGPSLRGLPYRVYAVDDDGEPVKTEYDVFRGRVYVGAKHQSIVSHREILPVGTNLHIQFRWVGRKIDADDLAHVLSMARNIGLGSAKSYERGKFEVVSFEAGD